MGTELDAVVLAVEDDNGAYYTLQIAFKQVRGPFRLIRVPDGQEALAFLRNQGKYNGAPRPALILLNLQLPKVNGFQVLETIKQDPQLCDIPAVVFTSSKLNSDRAKCMALGATDFIVKPDNFDDVVTAIKTACARA